MLDDISISKGYPKGVPVLSSRINLNVSLKTSTVTFILLYKLELFSLLFVYSLIPCCDIFIAASKTSEFSATVNSAGFLQGDFSTT